MCLLEDKARPVELLRCCSPASYDAVSLPSAVPKYITLSAAVSEFLKVGLLVRGYLPCSSLDVDKQQ